MNNRALSQNFKQEFLFFLYSQFSQLWVMKKSKKKKFKKKNNFSMETRVPFSIQHLPIELKSGICLDIYCYEGEKQVLFDTYSYSRGKKYLPHFNSCCFI